MSSLDTAPKTAYDALTATGFAVEVRPYEPSDEPAVRRLFAEAGERSTYHRFFSTAKTAGEDYIQHLDDPERTMAAIVVVDRGQVVAVGSIHLVTDPAADVLQEAEVALFVADDHQGEGVGTLILEDLRARALLLGISDLVACVLPVNSRMLAVFAQSGFGVDQEFEQGLVSVRCSVVRGPEGRARAAAREATAEVASLRQLLEPSSVAVVGAGRNPTSVGRQVLDRLGQAGFAGSRYAVNPGAVAVGDVPGFARVTDLPEPVDLVVLAVPSSAVLSVARDCAERGVRALLALTAGFGEVGSGGRAQQAELRRICRSAGMRLVGPNCIGVANTDPAVHLDATFLPNPVAPGATGVLSQSGAVAVGLIEELERRGAGVSSLVTVGNKADIGGNDLLPWWESDHRTRVIAAYLESIANPAHFAWLTRRVAATTPIVLLKSGRSPAAATAAQSHTAAAADDDAAVDALCRSGRILRVDNLRELADLCALAGMQPLPRGRRVAVVGNSGGPAVMATDACAAQGLVIAELAAETQERLRAVLPVTAATAGPVDVTATATLAQLTEAIQLVAGDDNVDAVVVVLTILTHLPVADLVAALDGVAAGHPDRTFTVSVFGADGPWPGRVPRFGQPDEAVAAVARLAAYAASRAEPDPVAPFAAATDPAVRTIVDDTLAIGGAQWLTPHDAYRLLDLRGFEVAPIVVADDAESAAEGSAVLPFPVVVKADGAGLLHKSDRGGVVLGLTGPAEVRDAVSTMARTFGDELRGVVVQPMVRGGVEVIVGAARDARFGPMVMIGRGGVDSDVDPDRAWALAPVDEATALRMIASLRSAPLLHGHRGRPAADLSQLAQVIVRMSELMLEVPEISEVDLNPVLARPDDAVVVDVRVRVTPPPEDDLLDHVRHLR